MGAALEATGLVKRYGATRALDGLDLAAAAGEIVGLIGRNAAGKTTFARAVAGLIALERGSIFIRGLDVSLHRRRVRAVIGLAPQELALYPTASARENLAVFAGLQGIRPREARRRIEEIARELVLSDVLDRRSRDLSGGQQRRLQAATAMIHRPEVLLLDEPTVGADPITRDALLHAVRAAADAGAAVVYTTHYLPELDALEATVAVVDRGRVIARGERGALLATVPGHATLEFADPRALAHSAAGLDAQWDLDGGRLTITAPDPASALVPWLAAHAELARGLRSIELHPPTLDDLYRSVVGA